MIRMMRRRKKNVVEVWKDTEWLRRRKRVKDVKIMMIMER